MSSDIRIFLTNSIKYDSVIGLITSIILYLFLGKNIAFIYLFGIIISMINFVLSGIILDKSINSEAKITKILFPITFILRITCVAVLALLFVEKISYLLAYLGGFVSHFPIIIFGWIKMQKGSE